MHEAQCVFIESQNENGLRWLIRVIRAGLSANRNYYPDAVLREAVSLFEGVPAFAKGDDDHIAGRGKSFRNLIGRITKPVFIEGEGADGGEICAVLELLESAGEIPAKIREAWRRGMTQDLFGFSIDAAGTFKTESGKRVATKISRANSVDLIIEPAAGGELISLIEAQDKRLEDNMHVPEPYKNRLTNRQFVPGLDRRDKLIQMLDEFFNKTGSRHSFKECYIELTGDRNVTGRIKDCDSARFREAFGAGDLGSVLGNVIAKRMVLDYLFNDRYSHWRKLARIASVPDFRTRHVTRVGGYGDLPTVQEGATYPALVSPDDEEATYALSKRGGNETITLEHIKNDDVGFIRSVPKKLAQAANRTLSKFVLDFLRTNPVIFDGQPLFSVPHSNLGSSALSAAAMSAARAAMRRQPELGSGDPLNIEPRYLWVPLDLEETAVNLFRRTTNNEKTALQELALEVLPIWYWTDANDWCLSADQSAAPTVEIGFLDGNEEPELFVQDAPSAGSMFSHDQLTWKIRHIYSGTPIEYKGAYKSVVT